MPVPPSLSWVAHCTHTSHVISQHTRSMSIVSPRLLPVVRVYGCTQMHTHAQQLGVFHYKLPGWHSHTTFCLSKTFKIKKTVLVLDLKRYWTWLGKRERMVMYLMLGPLCLCTVLNSHDLLETSPVFQFRQFQLPKASQ